MAYRVLDNKKYGAARLLITSNSSITIAGNNSVSNVAISDEVLSGGSISQVWFGSPSGNAAYWLVKRGSNTVGIFDSTSYLDFRGNGQALNIDASATLVANLVGATDGFLIIDLKKEPAANGFPTL